MKCIEDVSFYKEKSPWCNYDEIETQCCKDGSIKAEGCHHLINISLVMAKQYTIPVFALINGAKEKPYMCLWEVEKEAPNTHDINLEEEPEPIVECCGEKSSSFDQLLTHLLHEHGVKLQSMIDFCPKCEIIFGSVEEGMEHFIFHALKCKGVKQVRQAPIEHKDWVLPLCEIMKKVRKDLLHHLVFDGGKSKTI